MKKITFAIALILIIILVNAISEEELELKITKYYDYSGLIDSILFKYDLTDLKENVIDKNDSLYNSDKPIMLCIATPYSCSSCNMSFYPIFNRYTEIDSSRTCFIIENHYLRDTMKRYYEVKPELHPATRILFDTEGRNADLLKFKDTGNNFWFVVIQKGRIKHVTGFADYTEYCKPVKYYIEELDKYWMEKK